VIGGGPTGVELAGALAEIARHTLVTDFRTFDPRRARVILIENSPRILMTWEAGLAASAGRQLERLGVTVRTGALVEEIDPTRGVRLKLTPPAPPSPSTDSAGPVGAGACPQPPPPEPTFEWIDTHNVLWAAGVAASPLVRSLGVPLDRSGRVTVGPDLSIPDHPEVFVIGDVALLHAPDGKPSAGVAPGRDPAGTRAPPANIAASVAGSRAPSLPLTSTRDRSRRSAARPRWRTSDGSACAASSPGPRGAVIHIFFLIGFRNRTS
jgi:NADH dehydrogenase